MFTVPRSPLSPRSCRIKAVVLLLSVAAICLLSARDQMLPDSAAPAPLPYASVNPHALPYPPVTEQMGVFWASLR